MGCVPPSSWKSPDFLFLASLIGGKITILFLLSQTVWDINWCQKMGSALFERPVTFQIAVSYFLILRSMGEFSFRRGSPQRKRLTFVKC
jgi:hypothetical protein